VAAVIDSQTVRAAETVARSSRGYDAAKRANGRKRSVAVDLGGMLLTTLVTSAGVQDRDIARELLARLRAERPVVPSVNWADGAYRGTLVPWAAEHLRFFESWLPEPLRDANPWGVRQRRTPAGESQLWGRGEG
jgi:hypothetical protein